MIPRLVLLLLAGTVHTCFAQNDLKVSVILNKAQAGGTVRVALCSSKVAFDSEKGCKLLSAPADAQVVTVTLHRPACWCICREGVPRHQQRQRTEHKLDRLAEGTLRFQQ